MQLLTHGIAIAVMVRMAQSFIPLTQDFVSAMTMYNYTEQREVDRQLSSKAQENLTFLLQQMLCCDHQAIIRAHFVIR